MYTNSRIGQNIRYLVYKCWFYIKDNVRVAEQVKELVYIRDGMDEWLLERGEINDIINYLSTD